MTDAAHPAPAGLLARAGRVTVKIGSSLIAGGEGGGVSADWLRGVAADVAALRGEGKQVVLVSSGAVALGRALLGLPRSARLDLKQAAAAAGQPLLMRTWAEAFAPHGIATAQLLLTVDDTERRRRWLNARATLDALTGCGALPIVNENDSVATAELRYGDNDRLSARAAQLARSDLLLLLSDVDGLHTADPARDPAARHVPYLPEVTPEAEAQAGGASAAGVGTGGMRSKLAAAALAQRFGCATLIASGRGDRPIAALLAGARATVVPARGSPAGARKQWIAGALRPAGGVTLDAGAVAALRSGSSLLPAGVRAVDGAFDRGDCVSVRDPAGREIARGLAAYPAAEARLIAGSGGDARLGKLGYAGPDELIHRDDLALL